MRRLETVPKPLLAPQCCPLGTWQQRGARLSVNVFSEPNRGGGLYQESASGSCPPGDHCTYVVTLDLGDHGYLEDKAQQ